MSKSYKNMGWTIDKLLFLIVDENPCISYSDAFKKAKFFYKELNNLNKNMYNNNKKYFKYNLPLSLFQNNDDV